MNIKTLALAASLSMIATSANAATIVFDFDSLTDGIDISGTNLGGATFTAGVIQSQAVSGSNFQVTFSMFGVRGISVEFTGDGTGADITAFDGFGLGSLGGIGPASGVSGSVFGNVLFIDQFAGGLFSAASVNFGGTGITSIDNLTVETIDVGGSTVPVPASLPLMAAALVGAGFVAKRRARK
jgi:hypothetical protein